MNRFYVDPSQIGEELIQLSERETHHALHVLRVKPNESVLALDGQGTELVCKVEMIGKHAVSFRVEQRKSIPPLPYQVTLVQALPKGKAIESIIQKATELGAYRVVPLLAERTVVQIDQDNIENRLQKWNWVAIDAIKQCGSAWIPRIESPRRLSEPLARRRGDELNLIASLESDAKHPREFFAEFFASKQRRPRSITVWVGPEGDFTPAEHGAIRASGALPITLGPLVLRSDTAALYCLSILNYELQSRL
jgi:16S rRNA (uracil1498-N3)-methyltransferase